MSNRISHRVEDTTFHDDIDYIEALWQQTPIGSTEFPLIDIGTGDPLVCIPILRHLEFVYARQIPVLSQSRRVILYRRQETRKRTFGVEERVEELRQLLDGLNLEQVDLLGHGDAAMVLLEFAVRYPQRCRSLTIVAQGAEYRISPHPLIWWLHELYLRLPVERLIPAKFLRKTVINYITSCAKDNQTIPFLPRQLIEEQFCKISQWPSVYKYSVLPIIHNFTIKKQLAMLTMPVLLINRADDVLSPESETRWLATNLPNCAGYHVISGRERFFMYSQSETVTPLIEAFLTTRDLHKGPLQKLNF